MIDKLIGTSNGIGNMVDKVNTIGDLIINYLRFISPYDKDKK